ncbi:21904_t:CDS:2, partial [Entrophospora sp. SA101]
GDESNEHNDNLDECSNDEYNELPLDGKPYMCPKETLFKVHFIIQESLSISVDDFQRIIIINYAKASLPLFLSNPFENENRLR